MNTIKSPGAGEAAHGASEIDELGWRVASENSLSEKLAQAPILAMLFGSDRCAAEGINVRGYAPVLSLCRALIQAGYDPERALHAHRGGVLALAVRSIGEGAGLTVEDDRHGTPRLRRWRGRRGYGAGSPVRPTEGAAAAAPRHAIASGGRR
jgi:hypothetical protein